MNYSREIAIIDSTLMKYFGLLDYTSLRDFKVLLGKHGVMLCGGALLSIFTDARINDLDFYVRDPLQVSKVNDILQDYATEEMFVTKNATTFKRSEGRRKYTFQLIKSFSGEAEDIFRNFDFTITNVAFDFERNSFVFGERFFQDVAARRLVYAGDSKYPICAMYRTKKYMARGFECSGATIMHIALCIVQLKIESYADLKKQLLGIDTIYLQGLLESFEPNAPVDYGEFIDLAFKRINERGMSIAEEGDED